MSRNELTISFDVKEITDQVQPLITTITEQLEGFVSENNSKIEEVKKNQKVMNGSMLC